MQIFPEVRRPYFIGAPAWTFKSSGVRSLHLLCDALNNAGEKAWLLPQAVQGWCTHPMLETPVATQELLNFYKGADIEPVVVWPDVTLGNPLGYGKVVRWLLAPAGAYGGSSMEEFREWGDKVYSYRTDIENIDGVLCLPTFDPSVFHPPVPGEKRYGSCFYANKYDRIHGQKLLPVTEKSIRLQGSWKVIAEVLRSSEVCYVYEMTEIIVLAQMCGCKVSFVKTPYFAGVDLTTWDFAFDATISVHENVDKWEKRFEAQLEKFIGDCNC